MISDISDLVKATKKTTNETRDRQRERERGGGRKKEKRDEPLRVIIRILSIHIFIKI